jgi:hypothetical protein
MYIIFVQVSFVECDLSSIYLEWKLLKQTGGANRKGFAFCLYDRWKLTDKRVGFVRTGTLSAHRTTPVNINTYKEVDLQCKI